MTIHAVIRGRFRARLVQGDGDIGASLALRRAVFRDGLQDDRDGFDRRCQHVLIEEAATGDLLCSCRLLPVAAGDQIETTYAAQFYDLTKLKVFPSPMLEVGRFCVHPTRAEADVLRLAWAMIAAQVDAGEVGLLFGCSSFPGTEACSWEQAFSLLAQRHLAPPPWAPANAGATSITLAQSALVDRKVAMAQIPPLLRTYLAMGGWVSDHAVVDRDLGTVHVFTGVEIAKVPAARARALRAVLA